MPAKTKSEQVKLPPLRLEIAKVPIIGTGPLIVHQWNQKAIQEMLGKQMKLPKGAKEAKDPVADFLGSIYRTDEGYYGIPAVAIKNAMVTACTSIDGVTKVAARQAFQVIGERGKAKGAFCDIFSPTDLQRIVTPEPPRMREDMVRVGMGTADLRYRAELFPWAAIVSIRFNANFMSASQVLNLLNTAGFAVGLCEWRPEKGGQHGTFAVANDVEAKKVKAWYAMKQPEPKVPDVDAWLKRLGGDEPTTKPARKLRVA